jgi:curved DNA-binding protein CbpA
LQIPKDEDADREALRKAVRTFLLVLHPDKHDGKEVGDGEEENAQQAQQRAAFTEVTAYLNDVYGRITGKCG